MHQVAITGIGLICSHTRDPRVYLESISRQEQFYHPQILPNDPHQATYPVAWIDLGKTALPTNSHLRKMGRASKFSLAATQDALIDAGLNDAELASLGMIIATQSGEINHIEDYYLSFGRHNPAQASAFLFPNTVLNVIGGFLSQHFGLKNFCHTLSCRGSSGLDALEMAYTLVTTGRASRVLVIGTDEVSPATLRGYRDIGLLASYEQDKLTSGFSAAEGACALVLESLASAQSRQATIYGLVSPINTASAIGTAYDLLISGENGESTTDRYETLLQEQLSFKQKLPFKRYTGEYFGASGVFATALGCLAGQPKTLIDAYDYNGRLHTLEIVHD